MILPDVNVLVYAFRREADQHERYAAWLTRVVAGADEIALHDLPLSGFVRVATNPRVWSEPTPPALAMAFVARLRSARRSRWLSSGPETWRRFGNLVAADPAIRGNLVPDAFLAALALSHGCRLATADRGFARFPGLNRIEPAIGDSGDGPGSPRTTSPNRG